MTSVSSNSSNSSAAAEARAQWAETQRAPRVCNLLAAAGRDVVASHVYHECAVCQASVRSENCTCAKRRWTLTPELRSERVI
jgi:hypothetical protein